MHADVIIIGAGVIGTACACFLARKGATVLVLERNHLASGASGSTAAVISMSGSGVTPATLRSLGRESYELVLGYADTLAPAIELIRGGTVYVAAGEREIQDLLAFHDDLQRAGVACELLYGPDARRLEPLLAEHVAAALYNPSSYHVNPFRLCEAYLNAALRNGGRVEYGVTVTDVQVENDCVSSVITSRGAYQADWVVVAAGAHTPEIIKSSGIALPIVPARGQVIITEPYRRMTDHVIIPGGHMYTRQTAAGNFYLGSHTEYVGFDNRITLDKMRAFTQPFVGVLPLFGHLRALRCFAGFRPMCPDELPVIGPLPNCSRLVVASGHGRTGVRFSAATANAVSEMIIDGKAHRPMEAFTAGRFQR